MVPMAQWVGQQCFEVVGTGTNPSLCLQFLNLNITTKNRDTAPLLCMKSFNTRIFLKAGRVPLRFFFGTVRQSNFYGKS